VMQAEVFKLPRSKLDVAEENRAGSERGIA
jgi:hypothetical protein